MVTVYIEQSIEDKKHNKLATLNHNKPENSNLIMPFLVQKKDNSIIKGLTTMKKCFLFFLKSLNKKCGPYPSKCVKLYLCDYYTQN